MFVVKSLLLLYMMCVWVGVCVCVCLSSVEVSKVVILAGNEVRCGKGGPDRGEGTWARCLFYVVDVCVCVRADVDVCWFPSRGAALQGFSERCRVSFRFHLAALGCVDRVGYS